jgi:class 3 adenylate cyclase
MNEITQSRVSPPQIRAILFADLGGSTRLYDELGDVDAHRIAAECTAMIASEVQRHGGTVIKTIGDEVMSSFISADDAFDAAKSIQQTVAGPGAPGAHLGIHVGMHYGDVLIKDGDVFGDVVNLAARMVSLAKTGQILTTREMVSAMTPGKAETRQIDRREVKGKQEKVDIFEVIWQSQGLTTLTPILPDVLDDRGAAAEVRLILKFGDKRHEVNPSSPRVSIGRDAGNDLVVDDPRASRFHATVQARQGKFVLVDESTNGTVVYLPGSKPIVLCREELILTEAGRISIGTHPDTPSETPIYFYPAAG